MKPELLNRHAEATQNIRCISLNDTHNIQTAAKLALLHSCSHHQMKGELEYTATDVQYRQHYRRNEDPTRLKHRLVSWAKRRLADVAQKVCLEILTRPSHA